MPRTQKSTSRKRRGTTATRQTNSKRDTHHTNVSDQTRVTTTTQTDNNTPVQNDSFVTPPAMDAMYGYVDNVNQGYNYVDSYADQCCGNIPAQGRTIADPNIYGPQLGITHAFGPPPPPPPPQHYTQGSNIAHTPVNPASRVFGPPPPSQQHLVTQGANLVAPTSSAFRPPPPAPTSSVFGLPPSAPPTSSVFGPPPPVPPTSSVFGPPPPAPAPHVMSQYQGTSQVAPAGAVFEPPMLHGANTDTPASGASEVLVIGSSIIRDAFYYARENQGCNLGLDVNIIWDFRPGMKVQHLAKGIQQLSLKYQKYTDLLIIHCGGNDIGQTPLNEAELLAIRTLNDIHQLCIYKNCVVANFTTSLLPW
ncbi:uncharacterized protein LOC123551591 [Mercenaria mercenaria]|uniref:uncharacterized protein LOC123551591 n=1 Tax=Mercenaria mercenaria TaxID=6596 RepID=UPI001E1D351B|nr:uncharacterized protein LOC123551591 [Mercenaria mercenaria]